MGEGTQPGGGLRELVVHLIQRIFSLHHLSHHHLLMVLELQAKVVPLHEVHVGAHQVQQHLARGFLLWMEKKKKKTESEHSGWDAWVSDSIHVNGDHQINQSRPLWWQRLHPVSPIAGDQSVASFTPEFKSQASPKTWLVCQTRERRFTAV